MVRSALRKAVTPLVGAALRDLDAAPNRDDVALAELEREVGALAAGEAPIVAGPWLSEVGFEVLYWIPFLRWLRERYGIAEDRVVVVSRGGTGSWYEGIASRYVDVFDLVGVEDYRAYATARWSQAGGQKQIGISWWDELILERVAERVDLDDARMLHPGVMYRLFQRFWLGRSPLRFVLEHTRFERFAPPQDAELVARLPDEPYTAVKFYFRQSFPDTPSNRRLVARIVKALAEDRPVVLLTTGIGVDDHAEFDPGLEERVLRLVDGTPAQANLHAQSVAISRAGSFVGTYGGLAYLAGAYGVPALALWSSAKALVPAHLEMGRVVGDALGAPLTGLDASDLDVLAALAPGPLAGGARA